MFRKSKWGYTKYDSLHIFDNDDDECTMVRLIDTNQGKAINPTRGEVPPVSGRRFKLDSSGAFIVGDDYASL